ncbi:hypothetical protein [Amycolatopsis sp. NPDC051903]|uniref:hypothetical protein n=1 Tax=Amycolatopsis sp. NPDC051903 TaxID=3363936 RepID=UPI0037887ADC
MIIQDSLTADVLVAGRLARGTAGVPRADVEWLAPGVGMPCESCLGLAGADLPRSPLSELEV